MRVIKAIIIVIAFLFVLIHLFGLYLGVSNVFTAVILYGSLFYIFDQLIRKLKGATWARSNWRMSYWTVFIILISFELILRFGPVNYSAYGEKLGQFNYTCPFTQHRLESLAKRKVLHIDDVGLRTAVPNKTMYASKPEFNYAHSFNEIGLREETYAKELIDTSYVILGLGDSFTEGIGSPQDSTWTKLLENELRHDHHHVLGINGGNSGSDVVFEIYKLKHLLNEYYHPKLVILTVNSSDIYEIVFRGGSERFVSPAKMKYSPGPWWRSLFASSHIFRMTMKEVFDIESTYYTSEKFRELEINALSVICEEIQSGFISYAVENNIDYLVVFTPMLNELESGEYPLHECYNDLSSGDARIINLHDKFRSDTTITNYEDYFWPVDGHNNSRGYGYWAREMAREITPKIINGSEIEFEQ